MATQVLVPILGEAIGEARLVAWLKHAGDAVRRGDELAELETDKASLMIECPSDGVLLEIRVPAGEMVATGQVLAQVGRPGDEVVAAGASSVPAGGVPAPETSAMSPGAPLMRNAQPERRRISPAARRMARELNVDVDRLAPSRPGARITTSDVTRLLESERATSGAAPQLPQRRVPLSETQRVMAARMAQSAREIPQFSVSMEVDASHLLREKQTLSGEDAPVSVTALLIYLAARALARHPLLNARFDQDGIILYDTVNMGVAVASPQGLVVPVIHGAEKLELVELSRRLAALAQTARSGGLVLAQVSDGTFTLTNLGMYGVSQFAPLVNPPQAAILGAGVAHPVVEPTAEGTRHIQRMTLTVSADHRVVDGAAVALFLSDLRHEIEELTIS